MLYKYFARFCDFWLIVAVERMMVTAELYEFEYYVAGKSTKVKIHDYGETCNYILF